MTKALDPFSSSSRISISQMVGIEKIKLESLRFGQEKSLRTGILTVVVAITESVSMS